MDNAVIWLADEQHQHEVAQSQASVRAVMPDVRSVNMVVEHRHRLWYVNWIDALLDSLALDVQHFLFLDSDVYACASFADVFEVLRHYDLTSTHAPARQTTAMPFAMPGAFCEMNTGVLGYSNSGVMRNLFTLWREMLIKYADISGDNDQSALRIALWAMPEVRVWVMPPEYNCRFGFGGFAAGPIKLLHGRGYPYERAAEYLNRDHAMRAWSSKDLP